MARGKDVVPKAARAECAARKVASSLFRADPRCETVPTVIGLKDAVVPRAARSRCVARKAAKWVAEVRRICAAVLTALARGKDAVVPRVVHSRCAARRAVSKDLPIVPRCETVPTAVVPSRVVRGRQATTTKGLPSARKPGS